MAAPDYQEPTVTLPERFTPGKLGVVTVTFNSSNVLPDFLSSLQQQTCNTFELFAVDNTSKDDTVKRLREWGDPRLVLIANEHNLGVAAGNNQGICAAIHAGCEYVLLLNNDVVFGADLFQRLLDGLRTHKCQMTTPIIYYHDKPNIIWAAGGFYQRWLGYRSVHYGQGHRDNGIYSVSRSVRYAPTCCLMIRREVFARVGLMDVRYFVYHDDVDFLLRAANSNEILFLMPEAHLWHKVGTLTGPRSDFSIRFNARNRAFFLHKFLGRLFSLPFTFAYRIYYLLRYFFGFDSYRIMTLKQSAWTDGMRTSRGSGDAGLL